MSYQSLVPIHPGEYLLDELEYAGKSQKWLAERTGYSEKQISQIINGLAIITPELAIALENVLGIDASYWNNLTTNYENSRLKIEKRKRAEEEYEKHAEEIDGYYNILIANDIVERTSKKQDKTLLVLNFFEINSICQIENPCKEIVFRQNSKEKADKRAVSVWLKKAEKRAREESSKIVKFDDDKLKHESIIKLKNICHEMPVDFWAKSVKALAESGITLIAEKYISKSYVNGATKWIGDRPVIIMSDRGKSDDIVWFTLFHEIGHILKHGKKNEFISFDADKKEEDAIEKEADDFASEQLMSKAIYENFVCSHKNITRFDIEKVCKENNISKSIMVGRLQRDGYIPYHSFNNYKTKIIILDRVV